MAIEMAEAQTALVSGWMKEIEHLAGHAGLAEAELSTAADALKSARRSLEDAAGLVKTGPANPSFEIEAV